MLGHTSFLLNSDEWDYLSEGNQHLILKYLGKDMNFVGKVLRFIKFDPKEREESRTSSKIWLDEVIEEDIIKELIDEEIFGAHPVLSHYTNKVLNFAQLILEELHKR